MRIFYVSKIEDDQCYLVSPSKLYEETVSVENLAEFSKENTVVGYNSLTGKVEVKTGKDVFNYLNSKRKLVGQPQLEVRESVNIGEGIDIIKSPDRENTVILTTRNADFDVTSVYSTIPIDWIDIFNVIEEDMDNESDTVKFTLELDIDPPRKLLGFQNFFIYGFKEVDVTITSKRTDLFKNASVLCDFFLPISVPRKAQLILRVDLENCEFNPNCRIDFIYNHPDMVRCYKEIKMHESYYSLEYHHTNTRYLYSSLEGKNKLKDEEIVNYLVDTVKLFKTERKFTVRLNKLKYSDLLKMYNPYVDIEMSVDSLIIDSMVTVTPETKSLFNDVIRLNTQTIIITDDFDLDLDYETISTLFPFIYKVIGYKDYVKEAKHRIFYNLHMKDEVLEDDFIDEISNSEEEKEMYRKAQGIIRDRNSSYNLYAKYFDFKLLNSEIVIETIKANVEKAQFLAYMLMETRNMDTGSLRKVRLR